MLFIQSFRSFDWLACGLRKGLMVAALGLAGLSLAGCASTGSERAQSAQGEKAVGATDEGVSADALETVNRFSYAATDAVDKVILGPVADAYIEILPQPVQNGVSNFFDNMGYLNVVLNDLLQGKLDHGLDDSARFLVNSTLGLLGVVDVATDMGLEKRDEDFGQTLAVWGADSGPYLFVPMKGPSSLRDVADIPVSLLTNPIYYAQSSVSVPLGLLNILDRRVRADAAIRLRDQNALDPYVFTREAWRQARESKIYDGAPPDSLSDDLDGALDDLE